jgi:hypothetical protein
MNLEGLASKIVKQEKSQHMRPIFVFLTMNYLVNISQK